MKNIFSKFFKKETKQLEKETDKVISACISLMIEVSMADQSIDDCLLYTSPSPRDNR